MTVNIVSENPFLDWMRLINLCEKHPSLNTRWVEIFYNVFKNPPSDALSIVKDLEDIAEDLTKIKDAADMPLQLFEVAYPQHREALILYTQYLAQGILDSNVRETFLAAWQNNSYDKDFLELHVQTLGLIQDNQFFKDYYQELLSQENNIQELQNFKDACEKMQDKNETTVEFIKEYVKNENATIDKVIRYQELLNAVREKETPPIEYLKELYVDNKRCTLNELQEYIRVCEKAIQLSQYSNALKTFFAKKESEVMILMRYLHHGLLDFLGEDFKMNCVNLFVSQTPTIHIDISSKHQNLIVHLKSGFREVFDRMTELMGIYQKPFNSANINLRNSNQTPLSFEKYKAFYDSCWWTTNAQRKSQAKGFFEKLESTTKNPPDRYFEKMFELIFQTQKEMLESDKKSNTKRWFGFLNSKGYSRLYDITHGVFAAVMKAYLEAASQGLISETSHITLQEQMYKHFFDVHVKMLCTQLPQNHPLKLGLEALDKNSLTIESDFKKLLERQHKIPKHLKHLYESIQLFQPVLEKNAEFKAQIKRD